MYLYKYFRGSTYDMIFRISLYKNLVFEGTHNAKCCPIKILFGYVSFFMKRTRHS